MGLHPSSQKAHIKIPPGPIIGGQVGLSEMARTALMSMGTDVRERRVSVGIRQTYFGDCFGALARASAGIGRAERKD